MRRFRTSRSALLLGLGRTPGRCRRGVQARPGCKKRARTGAKSDGVGATVTLGVGTGGLVAWRHVALRAEQRRHPVVRILDGRIHVVRHIEGDRLVQLVFERELELVLVLVSVIAACREIGLIGVVVPVGRLVLVVVDDDELGLLLDRVVVRQVGRHGAPTSERFVIQFFGGAVDLDILELLGILVEISEHDVVVIGLVPFSSALRPELPAELTSS